MLNHLSGLPLPGSLISSGIKSVLFLTHAGDPGGAEYKMIDLCRIYGGTAEVLLLQHGSLEGLLRSEAVRFSVCPMPASTGRFRRESGAFGMLGAMPGALSLVPQLAARGRAFDVVVCFSQKSFVLASFAKPLMRRPILWFMNDILSDAHFSPAVIKPLTMLSRYSANHVVLNSQASMNDWIASGGRRGDVSVIYPGVREDQVYSQLSDPARIACYRRKYSPDGKPLIGMFGRISRWKGQDIFLRAIARIPEVRAVIAGAAHFSEETHERFLRLLCRELRIEDRVTFVGHVDDPMTIMAACDVVAHCSTAPEPFGLVIAEAMLAGTPVIASDAGGAREIIVHSETGQLTPLKDPEALAAAIVRYLANPDWSRLLARKARVRALERFSTSAMARGFLKIVESL